MKEPWLMTNKIGGKHTKYRKRAFIGIGFTDTNTT